MGGAFFSLDDILQEVSALVLGAKITRRPKLVVGNWKMCRDYERVHELDAIAIAAGASTVNVIICPPFPLIAAALHHRPALEVGGQDCHDELEGPHTGATSAALLHGMGASHVILGHSERRSECGESDAIVCAKAAAALRAGLTAIICVGESEADRADGAAARVVTAQIEQSIPATARPGEIVIAYEPIWAIGSGATPAANEIADIHGAIRETLRTTLGARYGAMTPILYGGSVNGANASGLALTPDVDGVLVGTSSLTARDFVPIIVGVARSANAHAPESAAA